MQDRTFIIANTTIEDKPEVRVFLPTESAWLAAAVDGEGSIGIYNGGGNQGRYAQIQVSNTDVRFVDRFKEIIGCGSSVMRTNFHKAHKGRKPIFHYALKGSSRCYWVLKQIEPYLIIKRDKALKIIEELETKPFGRWANRTPENKARASEIMRKTWAKRKGLL